MAGFRTIVIAKRCKLESMLGALVIRDLKEQRVNISEIETLIIESQAVAITAALIGDLIANNVNIIFCDSRHLPNGIVLPTHANYANAKNIKIQLAWSELRKNQCRALLIRQKLLNQAALLNQHNFLDQATKIINYAKKVADGDPDNFEARAAALYFRALFGTSFSRDIACGVNQALNYGYTLVMSTVAREIAAAGYLTELGLWHKGVENAFNLASDIMEPFRQIVDSLVYTLDEVKLQNEFKREMLKILFCRVFINGQSQSFVPAVRIFVHRVFRFMCHDVQAIYSIDKVEFDSADSDID